MDSPLRHRRHAKKDYSQRVEFPVEIVGRDNNVRRYAFDDAVRLYHRRMDTAPVRYADPDSIAAELKHCRLRVDQLRRSFLEAAGAPPLVAPVGVLASTLAADVWFFLRSAVLDASESLSSLTFVPMVEGPEEVWWVQGGQVGAGALLYLYRLDQAGPEGAEAAFQRTLARFQAASTEPGAERLYVGLRSRDVAVMLAGTAPWGKAAVLTVEQGDARAAAFDADDPLRAGLIFLQDGELRSALSAFEAGLTRDPSRTVLTRAAAVAALMGDEPARGEFAARNGLLLAPRDPGLSYLLAVALLRQGRSPELDLGGTEGPLAVLASGLALGQGRAWAALRKVRRIGNSAPSFAVGSAAMLRRWAVLLLALRGAVGLHLLCTLLIVAPVAPQLAVVAGLAGLLLLAGGEMRVRQGVRGGLRAGRFGRVQFVSTELITQDHDLQRQ